MDTEATIVVENLDKRFKNQSVLKNVNVKFSKGNIFPRSLGLLLKHRDF